MAENEAANPTLTEEVKVSTPSPEKKEKKDLNLLDMQKARQDLEKDAQLLANRIALLRQEDAKARKKIQEARKQARDLQQKKEQHEKQAMQKAEMKMRAQEEKEQNQQDFYALRKGRQSNIKSIQEQILAAKMAEAQARKKERIRNDKAKQGIIKEYVTKNMIKKTTVKTKEEMTLKKMKAFHEQKVETSKANHTTKMLKEQQKIKKKESELAKMERLESELIAKLKNTEKVQNEALQHLEEVIRSSGTMSSGKKSPYMSPRRSPDTSPK